LYAVGALVLLLPAIVSTFDAREVWRRIAWADPPPSVAPDREAPKVSLP
jgi:hypothetical protein